jgi:hypothetical protein
MAVNTANPRGEFLMMAVPTADNAGAGPVTGEPLMFGNTPALACVAQNSYTPPTGVPNPQGVGCQFIGVHFLSVSANNGASPPAGVAIAPGDRVYATGGTYDATTGCTYGFVLDANSSGRYFGNSLDALPSGQTGVVRVRLKVAG